MLEDEIKDRFERLLTAESIDPDKEWSSIFADLNLNSQYNLIENLVRAVLQNRYKEDSDHNTPWLGTLLARYPENFTEAAVQLIDDFVNQKETYEYKKMIQLIINMRVDRSNEQAIIKIFSKILEKTKSTPRNRYYIR